MACREDVGGAESGALGSKRREQLPLVQRLMACTASPSDRAVSFATELQ